MILIDLFKPLQEMWRHMLRVLADLITPLLDGLKTIWLLWVTPTSFFKRMFRQSELSGTGHKAPDTKGKQRDTEGKYLESAQFLLFGIGAATLANFEFDNSNRLIGLLGNGESSLLNTAVTALSNLIPSLSGRLHSLQAFFQGDFFAQLQTFTDPSLTAAITELIVNLLLLLVFTYLFFLLIGRTISTEFIYPFWLYVVGLQFVTTAVSRLLFNFISLPTFNLPPIAPELFFFIIESGLFILWYFLYPAWVLPNVFPNCVTRQRVLVASLLGRGIMAVAGWLIFGGFVLIATFFSTL